METNPYESPKSLQTDFDLRSRGGPKLRLSRCAFEAGFISAGIATAVMMLAFAASMAPYDTITGASARLGMGLGFLLSLVCIGAEVLAIIGAFRKRQWRVVCGASLGLLLSLYMTYLIATMLAAA